MIFASLSDVFLVADRLQWWVNASWFQLRAARAGLASCRLSPVLDLESAARPTGPPSQTWRTFLDNHRTQLVSVDVFTVPTLRFQVLYVFLVLVHDRRRIVHCNVTAHPTAQWTGQQLREAFPFDQLPLPAARPRRHLRPGLSRTGARHGHPRGAVRAALALVAGLHRARDWFHSAAPGPCDRVPGSLAPSHPRFLLGLLSPIANASLLGEGLASREGFSRQKWDPSWPCRRSADCTTVTNDGSPETHSP